MLDQKRKYLIQPDFSFQHRVYTSFTDLSRWAARNLLLCLCHGTPLENVRRDREHVSPRLISRQLVLASRPYGWPQTRNFRLEYDVMPDLPAGGVLLRVLYLSLDPRVLDRMDERRSNAKPFGIGEAIAGEGVSEVIASDSAAYAIGDLVLSSTGWRTHVASDGTGLHKLDCAFASVTTALGVLGTPGFARLFGHHTDRQAQGRRDRRGGGRQRPSRLIGRSARQDGWRARRRHCQRAGKVPLS